MTRDATPEERAAGAPRRILDVDHETAPYAKEMFNRIAAGQTVRAVATWTVNLPESARGGRKLSYTLVRFLLRSPIYVARSEQGAPDVLSRPRGRWPALVDDGTWQAVQERLDRHKNIPRQASGRYLLTGLARCPRCGGRMIGARRNDGGRSQYRCAKSVTASLEPCHYSVPAPTVDTAVLVETAQLLDSLTAREGARAALERAWAGTSAREAGSESAKRIRSLERDKERARDRLRNAALLLVDGTLDKAGYDLARDAAQRDLDAASAELDRLREETPTMMLPALADILRVAGDWEQVLRESDVLAQRDVLALLIDRVVLERTGWRAYDARVAWTPLGEALRSALTASKAA